MRSPPNRPVWSLVASVLVAALCACVAAPDAAEPVLMAPDDLAWEQAGPHVRVAVLHGEPTSKGVFVVRQQLAPGFRKDPHYHPADSRATVLAGRYSKGYASAVDRQAAHALDRWSFSTNPAGVSHYEWADTATIVQGFAHGPWRSIVVDEADRPVDADDERLPSSERSAPVVTAADALEWTEVMPGVRSAILAGDPEASGLFTRRFEIAPGVSLGPHHHPTTAYVTMLSGTIRIGFGDAFDESTAYGVPEGGFLVIPAGTVHYEWFPSGAVVEIHAEGPWQTIMASGDEVAP